MNAPVRPSGYQYKTPGYPSCLLPAAFVNPLKVFYANSDGETVEIPRFYRQAEKRLNRLNRRLQTDGVAQKKMRYCVVEAEKLLDETLERTFDVESNQVESNQNLCWVMGERKSIARVTEFKAMLSAVCDRVYRESPTLRNELKSRCPLCYRVTATVIPREAEISARRLLGILCL